MINIVSKTCVHDGCRKQRMYNSENETTPLYCSEHKTSNMVNKTNKILVCDSKSNYKRFCTE